MVAFMGEIKIFDWHFRWWAKMLQIFCKREGVSGLHGRSASMLDLKPVLGIIGPT